MLPVVPVMPCYCGCATRQSRWIWSLFALFAIGGLCFHVPSYVKTVNCGKAYDGAFLCSLPDFNWSPGALSNVLHS